MTRINCVPVTSLTRQHLVAEYRELLRLNSNVKRWLKAKNPTKIPMTYRMGKGHVTFFYDKLVWLEKRHAILRDEMTKRGYQVNYELKFVGFPKQLYNDWVPTTSAIEINKSRIAERLS